MDKKNRIARRAAQELSNNDVVNLGIGIPSLVANHIPSGVRVTFHSENGLLGAGPAATAENQDTDICNAGGFCITVLPGASFFDSAASFGISRGGHVDVTILGALQVDAGGNLASWLVPGKMVAGMGGAMDLVMGARRVVVAMEHVTKTGCHKILEQCTFPLTATNVVDTIVTDMAVLKVTPAGLVLREIAPGLAVEQVQAATGARLIVPPDLAVMDS